MNGAFLGVLKLHELQLFGLRRISIRTGMSGSKEKTSKTQNRVMKIGLIVENPMVSEVSEIAHTCMQNSV